jgi:excisionase family DNA binding protein
MSFTFQLPDDFVEQLARRVAELSSYRDCGSTEPYLDVTQAASYLACNKDRIYDLKAMGRLRYAQDGRRLLFRREWLDEALEVEAA